MESYNRRSAMMSEAKDKGAPCGLRFCAAATAGGVLAVLAMISAVRSTAWSYLRAACFQGCFAGWHGNSRKDGFWCCRCRDVQYLLQTGTDDSR